MSEQLPSDAESKMVVFGAKQIRRVFKDGEWFFSVVDIIAALTDSVNPRDYWYPMKQREKASRGIELSTLCRQLKLTSADGKTYQTDCVKHRSRLPRHPVDPQRPSRAVQTLAGRGRLRARPGDRKPRTRPAADAPAL